MPEPEGLIVCGHCGSRSFYAVPDGAESYLLECQKCGQLSELSAGPGTTLTLTEVEDETP